MFQYLYFDRYRSSQTAAKNNRFHVHPVSYTHLDVYKRQIVLELPEGDYSLYAVANAGADMGEQTRDYIRTLRFEQTPDALADGPLPMSAEQTVSVRGDMHINVTLVRAVAKIDFSCTVAAEFAPKLQIKSVRICNAPCSMSLFEMCIRDRACPELSLSPLLYSY